MPLKRQSIATILSQSYHPILRQNLQLKYIIMNTIGNQPLVSINQREVSASCTMRPISAASNWPNLHWKVPSHNRGKMPQLLHHPCQMKLKLFTSRLTFAAQQLILNNAHMPIEPLRVIRQICHQPPRIIRRPLFSISCTTIIPNRSQW